MDRLDCPVQIETGHPIGCPAVVVLKPGRIGSKLQGQVHGLIIAAYELDSILGSPTPGRPGSTGTGLRPRKRRPATGGALRTHHEGDKHEPAARRPQAPAATPRRVRRNVITDRDGHKALSTGA